MARLKTVVDESLTVSTAFTSINSQAYNELSGVNWADNDKTFPYLLIDKRSFEMVVNSYTKTGLPRQTTYTSRFYFFNTYTETEKASTTLQTKQDELIDIASKYFAELRSRNESGANGFFLGTTSFNSLDEMQNGDLLQLSYNVEFIVNIENCSLGTFVY